MNYTFEQLDCVVKAAIADERRRCAADIRKYIEDNIERWAALYGEDRAKALALDIESAARILK